MNFQNNVKFPAHCKPLPTGYRIAQLDSGHYLWICDSIEGGAGEGSINVDRWQARRDAFAHAKQIGLQKQATAIKMPIDWRAMGKNKLGANEMKKEQMTQTRKKEKKKERKKEERKKGDQMIL